MSELLEVKNLSVRFQTAAGEVQAVRDVSFSLKPGEVLALVGVAPTKERYANPQHPYTRTLLSAIPIPDPRRERARKLTVFDPRDLDRDGELVEVSPDHFVLESRKGKGKI